jgi:hypothetical protein
VSTHTADPPTALARAAVPAATGKPSGTWSASRIAVCGAERRLGARGEIWLHFVILLALIIGEFWPQAKVASQVIGGAKFGQKMA